MKIVGNHVYIVSEAQGHGIHGVKLIDIVMWHKKVSVCKHHFACKKEMPVKNKNHLNVILEPSLCHFATSFLKGNFSLFVSMLLYFT